MLTNRSINVALRNIERWFIVSGVEYLYSIPPLISRFAMRLLFFKLYLRLLLATASVVCIAWLSFDAINHWRLQRHLVAASQGTQQLLLDGVNRHQGEKQAQWLDVVSKLFAIRILDENSEDTLPIGRDEIELLINNEQEEIRFVWREYDEVLLFGISQLILNELGRHELDQRDAVLNELNHSFNFAIQKLNYNDLGLNATELRQLNLNQYLFKTIDGYKAYSRVGNSDEVLFLGPIKPFDPYPIAIIVFTVLICFLLIVLLILMQLKPIEVRLAKLAQAVDATSANTENINFAEQGDDGLARFSQQIEHMARRITSLAKQQKELTRAVSHEFRTPLTRMSYRLNLVADEFPEDHQRFVGLNKDVNELKSLVDELLTYTNLEADDSRFEFRYFDLHALLHELVHDLQPLANAQLTLINLSDDGLVHADRTYIKRALQNIIINAQRYAKQSIMISLNESSDYFAISISNDGEPIDLATSRDIFLPFKVLDKSRNKKTGGHGLGLSIVQAIVKWHQGEIVVINGALGGAEFVLTIPKHQ